MTLKERFEMEAKEVEGKKELRVLTTAVKLPTGAIEVITNTQFIGSKMEYLLNAYDDEFKLKNNPQVQIVGYMLV
jgi:hypothetical protein